KSLLFQVKNDLLRGLFGAEFGRVDHDFCICRNFIWIGNACEFLHDSGARLSVQALAIAFLTSFDRGGNMDQNKPAVWINETTHVLAGRIIRRNWSAYRDPAVLSDFGRNVADSPNVDVAVLLREAEFRRKMFANQISVKYGY